MEGEQRPLRLHFDRGRPGRTDQIAEGHPALRQQPRQFEMRGIRARENESYQTLLCRGVEFAATGKVTIE